MLFSHKTNHGLNFVALTGHGKTLCHPVIKCELTMPYSKGLACWSHMNPGLIFLKYKTDLYLDITVFTLPGRKEMSNSVRLVVLQIPGNPVVLVIKVWVKGLYSCFSGHMNSYKAIGKLH